MDTNKELQTKKRKKPRAHLKGRVLRTEELQQTKSLIEGIGLERDKLIEALHRIQDKCGYVDSGHIHSLAHLFHLNQAQVYEVATFYAHFHVVKEGADAPPPVTIRVCESLSCSMAGGQELYDKLRQSLDGKAVRIEPAPCMGRCAHAPVASIGHHQIECADVKSVLAELEKKSHGVSICKYEDLKAYQASHGYDFLLAVREGRNCKESVLEQLEISGLSGLGGAGFSAARKWSIVSGFPGPRLMTINGDEGEPGTFKDREVLSQNPHRVLEGALIAAEVVGVERIYFYLRDEYPQIHKILGTEIESLERQGIISPDFIELRRGAGAYICGEESAMLESIEGKRGLPRHRPPYIAQRGLFGRPTLNHNVETLYWVPQILEKGGQWFADLGKNGGKGVRSYSVSGRVRKPGVIIAPAGSTARDLINLAGGMVDGHELYAFLPGGASGGILPASHADVPLDFGTLAEYGCFVGSHAVVILSQADDLKEVAINIMNFFAKESCGQCTPCREGTVQMLEELKKDKPDFKKLDDLEQVMRSASICGLGQAAPNPVCSIIRFFGHAALQRN